MLPGPCLAPNHSVEKGISQSGTEKYAEHESYVLYASVDLTSSGMVVFVEEWQKPRGVWPASVFEMKLASPHMPDHLSVRLRNSSLYQYAIIRRSYREAFNFAIRQLVSSGNELPFSLTGPLYGVRVPMSRAVKLKAALTSLS